MIGFIVETLDIHANADSINTLFDSFQTDAKTIKKLTKDTFIPNFEYHYHSTHTDIDDANLKIYHLMFDFSENIA